MVPDELKAKFDNFRPVFRKTEVGKNDFGKYMQNCAIENDLHKHRQQKIISRFKLKTVSIITFLNFNIELRLQYRKLCRFVEYSPPNCFNKFNQSVVDARSGGDANPLSGVVAETIKILVNSSNGYQIMDKSRHTITNFLRDEKTHKGSTLQKIEHCSERFVRD